MNGESDRAAFGLTPMRERILLTLIVLAAAFLRLYNLGWGLPEVFEEATPWRQAWEMWGGATGRVDFNPHFFNYPAFAFYIQWAGQGLVYLAGRVTGEFSSTQDMLMAFEASPARFILVGRLITSLFGIASVYLIYRIGRDFFSPLAGLVAAVFLALNFSHIRRGQFIATDVPLVFFILLAFIPIYKIATDGNRRHYIWAGVCVGLAAGVKYPGFLTGAGIVAAHVFHDLSRRHSWKNIVFDPSLWMSGAAALLVFFAVSPYCFLDYSGFYRDFRFEQTHMKVGHFGAPERLVSYHRYVISIIPAVLTLPVAFVALLGLVYGILKRRGLSIVLLTFPLVYFAVVGSWKTAADHYIFPAIPFLLVFAGLLLWTVFERVSPARSRLPRGLLLGVTTCLLLIPSVLQTYGFYAHPDTPDNRTIARGWVAANIERGAAVVKEKYTPDLSPRDFVVFELPLSTLYPNSTAPFYDLRWYTDFDYVVISSEVYRRYRNAPGTYPAHERFYRELETYWTLIKQFDDRSGSGPHLKIYRVAKPAGREPDEEFPPDMTRPLLDSQDRQANAKLLVNLGNAFSNMRNPVKAARLYRLAVGVDPTLSKGWYNLGLTLGNAGRLPECEDALNRAVELDSTYAKAWVSLGDLYINTGRPELSAEAYERGLKYSARRPDILLKLGEQYLKEGRADEAISAARRGLELSGNNPEFQHVLGLGYLAKGDRDSAIESLRAASEARPSNGKYAYSLASAYYSKGNRAAALEHARRAEQLGYDATELLDALR